MKGVEALYVGADDSNHAGQDKKGEIIAATFSINIEYSVARNFPSTRNQRALQRWLDLQENDFRFLILSSERYRHSGQNLVEALPDLVMNYLLETELAPETLMLYLDGELNEEGEDFLRNRLRGKGGIERVFSEGFPKKRKTPKAKKRKGMYCPALVYYADILANRLYRTETFKTLSQHEKFVGIR